MDFWFAVFGPVQSEAYQNLHGGEMYCIPGVLPEGTRGIYPPVIWKAELLGATKIIYDTDHMQGIMHLQGFS